MYREGPGQDDYRRVSIIAKLEEEKSDSSPGIPLA